MTKAYFDCFRSCFDCFRFGINDFEEIGGTDSGLFIGATCDSIGFFEKSG